MWLNYFIVKLKIKTNNYYTRIGGIFLMPLNPISQKIIFITVTFFFILQCISKYYVLICLLHYDNFLSRWDENLMFCSSNSKANKGNDESGWTYQWWS